MGNLLPINSPLMNTFCVLEWALRFFERSVFLQIMYRWKVIQSKSLKGRYSLQNRSHVAMTSIHRYLLDPNPIPQLQIVRFYLLICVFIFNHKVYFKRYNRTVQGMTKIGFTSPVLPVKLFTGSQYVLLRNTHIKTWKANEESRYCWRWFRRFKRC